MSTRPIHPHPASGLASLLHLRGDEEPPWGVADLRAIWLHQMSLQIHNEIAAAARHPLAAGDSGDGAGAGQGSFGGLLQNPRPPLELLKIVKDYAKRSGESPDLLPERVALAIYYAVIAMAQVRHGQNISQIDAKARQAAFTWCAAQSWLDETTRSLFRQTIAAAAQGSGPPSPAPPDPGATGNLEGS